MRKPLLSFITSFCLYLSAYSQSDQNQFFSVNSVYDYSASEWSINGIDSQENEWEASMYLKWPLRNDWTHWTVDYKDYYYTIKRRWNHSPIQWELVSPNLTVSIRQKWRNDLNEWEIYYGDHKIIWKTNFPNEMDQWFFEIDQNNYFDMWTRYNGDPRDWDIEDQAPQIPDEVKIAVIFTTIYLSNSKN